MRMTDETNDAPVADETAVLHEQPAAAAELAEEQSDVPTPVRTGPRPRRDALIPLWVYGVLAAVLAVVAIAVGAQFALHRSVTATVPSVVGLDLDVARTRLLRAGFDFAEGDRRFSVRPEGEVLSQSPAAGRVLRRGSTVAVVASAGTERFKLPDVIGDGIALAKGTLEGKGLEVKVTQEASSQPKDTVLATNPSPGAQVRTGDIVIVTVAATSTIEGTLVPYQFDRALVVIDPSKASAQGTDITLEVARRLRSLLEASGAAVLVTRSLADRDFSIDARAKRASGAAATAVVGLDVLAKGPGGYAVGTPSTLSAAQIPAATELSDALSAALTVDQRAPERLTFPGDAVSAVVTGPIARVTLGSLEDKEDAAALRDPNWADQVARMLYKALGEQYGRR